MPASALGLSLEDLQRNYSYKPLSRRIAERLRDAVERLFPQMEQANPGEVPKRWRLPGGTVNGLASVTADELADLATKRCAYSVMPSFSSHSATCCIAALVRGSGGRSLSHSIIARVRRNHCSLKQQPPSATKSGTRDGASAIERRRLLPAAWIRA